MSVTASASRRAPYTQPHRCRRCGKTFWARSDWNRVTVVCPHCRADN